MPIAELDNLDRVLVVGSFLRKDHPLMAQRLRQAAKRGTQILLVDSAADDPLMPVAGRITVALSELARALAEVAVALAQARNRPCRPSSPRSRRVNKPRSSPPAWPRVPTPPC